MHCYKLLKHSPSDHKADYPLHGLSLKIAKCSGFLQLLYGPKLKLKAKIH